MAEVMLGKELHPDRVIPVEKLYEILNEYGINYSFPAQYGIENNAFAVVRCKDCKHCIHLSKKYKCDIGCEKLHTDSIYLDFWCRYGERKDNA